MRKWIRLRTPLLAAGILMSAFLGAFVFNAPSQALGGAASGITFTREHNGGSAVWSVKTNGTQARQLARGASPAVSPSGNWVAYVAGGQLKLMTKQGLLSHDLAATPGGVVEGSPVWSRDGKWLAFVRAQSQHSAVFVVSPYDPWRRAVNVTGWKNGTLYRSPTWAPDAKRLAYEKVTAGGGEVVVKTLATGAAASITEISDVTESAELKWSPHGHKLLFKDSENELYTIRPDEPERRATIADGDSYDGAWSSDGKRIAFLEDFSGEYLSISEEDGTVTWHPLGITGYDEVRRPVWSRDGKKVLVVAYRDNTSALFALDLQSGATTKLYGASGRIDDVNW